jgi:tetratricopeptide (TPR) repeat protein
MRWAVYVVLGLLVTGGAAVVWWRHSPGPPPEFVFDQDEDSDDPLPTDAGYMGPQACAECHARRVNEFLATSHYRTCRLPQSDLMPVGFTPGHGTYRTRDPGLRFEMTREGSAFLQTAVRATPAGERRTTERIDLIYGAGAADEVYLSWHGDKLYELPMAWLHPLNQWGASPFDRYGGGGEFARDMTPRCVECHNTWFEHVAGSHNQYFRDNIILGVTCEKCHGPGREHVAYHKAHPEDQTAHAIVHPGHLTRELQLDVCAQCHTNATKRRGPAFSYRPGQPLTAFFRITRSDHPENDHVANQVKYLRQSKCFQKTETLTCTTCHNPHRSRSSFPSPLGGEGGVRGSDSDQRSCLKCHQPKDCAEQERLPVAVRGNCVGCHMPAHYKINVSFHTEDDEFVPPITRHEHRIAIYPAARQEALLMWYRGQTDAHSRQEAARLTDALVDHWLTEAEGYHRAYRFMAEIGAIREALRLDPSRSSTRSKLQAAVALPAKLNLDLAEAIHLVEEKRYAQAIKALHKILAVKPDVAVAHGKLGTVYALSGQHDLSVKHLQAVAQHDPDDPYGYMMLGWLAYLQGRPEQAIKSYRLADEIDPYNAKIHYHWGLALAKLGRLSEAGEYFRRVLVIDPKHAEACQSLSQVLRQQGQAAEAVRFARRAARLSHFENAEMLLGLAEAYADAGRFTEALDTATQALEVAQTSNPQLVPHIHRRLDEIRTRAD